MRAAACTAVSAQGNVCARDPGHVGCHEVYVDGDGRRWWDDARGISDAAVEAVARALSPGAWWDRTPESEGTGRKEAAIQGALRSKARGLLEIAAAVEAS